MKISLITFHNALNYGALLQTYAFQEYLRSLGHTVEVIDFRPKAKFIGLFSNLPILGFISSIISYLRNVKRKKHFYRDFNFRNRFSLTKRYNSFMELVLDPPVGDALVCGSDQVWNPKCFANCHSDTIKAYLLNFGNAKSIRVAFSVSIGTSTLDNHWLNHYIPILKKFDHISLREPQLQKQLEQAGIFTKFTCDPTLLHSSEFYDKLIPTTNIPKSGLFIFNMNNSLSTSEINIVKNKWAHVELFSFAGNLNFLSVGQWLGFIKYSSAVITDSYHGLLFSIIYKKPFIAILADDSKAGLNDRIHSILNIIGLSDRAVSSINKDNINLLSSDDINWEDVTDKLFHFTEYSKSFLCKALGAY